jgi:hypothetical protein
MHNLKYKISVDRTLENSLEEKQEKLQIVRSVHHRHQADLEEVPPRSRRKGKRRSDDAGS